MLCYAIYVTCSMLCTSVQLRTVRSAGPDDTVVLMLMFMSHDLCRRPGQTRPGQAVVQVGQPVHCVSVCLRHVTLSPYPAALCPAEQQLISMVIYARQHSAVCQSTLSTLSIHPFIHFTARCYAERGYAIACRRSVCLSVKSDYHSVMTGL